MNRIQRIFNPTAEEEIQDLRRLARLHIDQIGHCSTCKYYIASTEPGFVTDYGSCAKKNHLFPDKVCGLADVKCMMYEENTEKLMDIIQKIQNLTDSVEGAIQIENKMLINDSPVPKCSGKSPILFVLWCQNGWKS